ncbi:MAG: CopD family protein [Gammaproteobacteria bacterium]|nr:CopD family protein [Gammaproteobacteria bacterium]
MLWLKALHLIAMVTWFAGLFYLPRLYVYHAMSDDAASIARFKIMERKLFWGITTPGGVLTLFFGSWMLIDYGWAAWGTQLWLHAKLSLILLLVLYHIMCGKLLADFKHDRNQHSHIWYRWFNEAPVLLLIAIILLATLKPVSL